MNWLKFLVGASALIVAGCAAYFSVTGLGVLFVGSSVAVMVMASALELAKLVTATYLKQKWDEIKGFNKWYLTASVITLMLITSAGIFGYLSNAFQAQSLELQRVDREIAVHQTKITINEEQITQFTSQITNLQQNSGKLIDGGRVNSRLIRSIDNRDKEITKINDKISKLQEEIASETEKINQIKISNLDLEKEVGGFRFVAEAFELELNTVVKFFILLIVIVFDPLAVALIIAFNGLIGENRKEKEHFPGPIALGQQAEAKDYELGMTEDELRGVDIGLDDDGLHKLYEIYGDKPEEPIISSKRDAEVFFDNVTNQPTPNEALTKAIDEYVTAKKEGTVEKIYQNIKDNGKNLSKVVEDGVIVENNEESDEIIQDLKWEGYMHPDFPWQKRNLWINNPKAVQYWISSKGGNMKEFNRIRNEEENIKKY